MKKILVLLIIICLSLSVFGCDTKDGFKLEEISTQVENESVLSSQIGFEVKVPKDIRGVTFENINGTIAQMTFSYEGFFFTYRASKIYSLNQLFGIYEKPEKESSFIIDDERTATVFDFKDGTRTVAWYDNGTHKSLSCKKNIAESWFSQLCEQM